MLSHISKNISFYAVCKPRIQAWPACVIFLCMLCAHSFALEHNLQQTDDKQNLMPGESSVGTSENTIPGSIKIGLSTFHELRGEFKEQDTRLQLRSKMSGAYDVSLAFIMDDIQLTGSFDLVNESMVLDGNNAILKPEHKKAFSHARQHLIKHLQKEFQDEFPEHSFLAVQMLGYWSRAPKGHPIGRREIESKP